MKFTATKFAMAALAGALALSSIGLAQAAGPGGTAGASGTAGVSGTASTPSAGSPPGATTGQAKPGAMGDPSGAAANPSGNSLINTSPSGSTLDQTGTGSKMRR
jgi:hypothetical protein